MQEGQDRRRSRRITQGLFVGGFITFVHLYCVQPLLPEFSARFHVPPRRSQPDLVAVHHRFGGEHAGVRQPVRSDWPQIRDGLVAGRVLAADDLTGLPSSFSMLAAVPLGGGRGAGRLAQRCHGLSGGRGGSFHTGCGHGAVHCWERVGGHDRPGAWRGVDRLHFLARDGRDPRVSPGLAGAAWFAWWLPRSDSRHRHGGGSGGLAGRACGAICATGPCWRCAWLRSA